jgi:hypothetical protein
VLSVFFDLQILVISFVSFCHWFVCVLRFTNSGYLFEICWPLCCLSSLIYIFWLSLWYLLAIVLSVFFDLHVLAFLWYLLAIGLSVFFELRILAISFVSFCHWFVCVLRFTNSGDLFEICWPLCCLSSLIYIFCLSLWYLLAIVFSVFFDLRILLSLWYLLVIVLSVFFDLRFLGISLVYVAHCVVCLLRFTDSGYLFWYMFAIVLSVFFDLHILVISLVSVGHCVVCLL